MNVTPRRFLFFVFTAFCFCSPVFLGELGVVFAVEKELKVEPIETTLFHRGNYDGVIAYLGYLSFLTPDQFLSADQYKVLIDAHIARSNFGKASHLCEEILRKEQFSSIHDWALQRRSSIFDKLRENSPKLEDDGLQIKGLLGKKRRIIRRKFEFRSDLSDQDNVASFVRVLKNSAYPVAVVEEAISTQKDLTEKQQMLLGQALGVFVIQVALLNPTTAEDISSVVVANASEATRTAYTTANFATAATTRSGAGSKKCSRTSIRLNYHRRRMFRHHPGRWVFCR